MTKKICPFKIRITHKNTWVAADDLKPNIQEMMIPLAEPIIMCDLRDKKCVGENICPIINK